MNIKSTLRNIILITVSTKNTSRPSVTQLFWFQDKIHSRFTSLAPIACHPFFVALPRSKID